MNRSKLLTIFLGLLLIVSLAYSFVLSRQSEAAIFRGADGEITAVSGIVLDASNLRSDNYFELEEPDTGVVFRIIANQSTQVRFLSNEDEFIDVDFGVIMPSDVVFVEFGADGKDGVAKSIDILPQLETDEEIEEAL